MTGSFRKTEILPGLAHFFVDLTCTALLGSLSLRLPYDRLIACAILYNCLAFAFQLPIGLLADLLRADFCFSAAGCVLVAVGAFFRQPLFLCLFIGLGNACFHVGSGRQALRSGRGTAAAVGRFVAPGALGIFFGPRLGAFRVWIRGVLPLGLLLLAALFLLRPVKLPAEDAAPHRNRAVLMAGCMFLTVLLRSYVGTVLRYPVLSGFGWALSFSLCIFAGKFFGGILADRFGFLRSSLCTQLGACLLLSLSLFVPFLALPGILLFNTSMAVTATALYRSFPSLPGTMFGLTTLALFLGVLPRLLGWENRFFTPWGVALLCLLSAASVLLGLMLVRRGDGRAAITGTVTGSDAGS